MDQLHEWTRAEMVTNLSEARDFKKIVGHRFIDGVKHYKVLWVDNSQSEIEADDFTDPTVIQRYEQRARVACVADLTDYTDTKSLRRNLGRG